MIVMDWKTFAAMPAGTVFSFYTPCVCECLCRKGETICNADGPIDFLSASIVAECDNGGPPAVDGMESRWGMYDYDQQFAVYEEPDIKMILDLLTTNPKETA